MRKFDALVSQVRSTIPDDLDACVSFVLFHNDRQEITEAIDQVRAEAANTHIVIVDNSVPPLDLAHASAGDVTIAATNENIGYGRGHNIALAASQGKCRYNVVMNTDLKTDGTVITGMIAFMDDHPEAGLAMPRICYPDGSLQRLCRLLPDPRDIVARRLLPRTQWGKDRNERYEFHEWNYDKVAEFPFLSGCFMMLRRSVLDVTGYFDERYFLYAEDLDLSRRIRMVSRTLFNPDQTAVHEYRSQTKPSFARKRYALNSMVKYFNKWGWRDSDRDRINDETINRLQR